MNGVRGRLLGRGAVIVALVCCLPVAVTLVAQSKKSAKQAESLEKAGDSAKAATQKSLDNLKGVLAGYNAIVGGEAKDPQSAYKKLVGDLKNTEKSIDGAKKEVAALQKEADKFFKAWESDLGSISSDSLREKSASRMELAKQRYASIGEMLEKARDELAQVVRNLNDQVLYLGRDLSPEAIADLQDEAAALNQQAADAAANVKAMLASAGQAQEEADYALEGDEGS